MTSPESASPGRQVRIFITANSWEYCRHWIDRVEPFFVCMLGQQYEWIPRVEDFKDEEDRTRRCSLER
jgi:hypothetical protein